MKKSCIHPALQMAEFWLLCLVAQDAIIVNQNFVMCNTAVHWVNTSFTTPTKCQSGPCLLFIPFLPRIKVIGICVNVNKIRAPFAEFYGRYGALQLPGM